jgi:hypothetical protein
MTARTQEHTPGPWRVHDNGLGEFSVLACHETMRIASCSIGQISDHANARLIAAAPDLLDALERIAEHESRYQDSASYREAVAAIARARGSK